MALLRTATNNAGWMPLSTSQVPIQCHDRKNDAVALASRSRHKNSSWSSGGNGRMWATTAPLSFLSLVISSAAVRVGWPIYVTKLYHWA